MRKCYINGMACISAQETFDTVFPGEYFINNDKNVLAAALVDYKEFIAPAAGRRMARGVKNGIAAAARALHQCGAQPDAIITGTGIGCSIDSEKFLQAVIDNNEQFLTPTSFIQSTHNTVGAQIALGLGCKAYNFTYVNGAVSFESALVDAMLQIEEGEATNVLTGGIEENSVKTIEFYELSGIIKDKNEAEYKVLDSATTGVVLSEGAVFFVVSDTRQDSSYAELCDVSIYNTLEEDEVTGRLAEFLSANGITISDIDAVILGYNGDVDFDGFYRNLAGEYFKDTEQLYYKHLSGEFNTASAFGLWMAANILKAQQVPDVMRVNSVKAKKHDTVLLYNQYRGKDHSFTLLRKC